MIVGIEMRLLYISIGNFVNEVLGFLRGKFYLVLMNFRKKLN